MGEGEIKLNLNLLRTRRKMNIRYKAYENIIRIL